MRNTSAATTVVSTASVLPTTVVAAAACSSDEIPQPAPGLDSYAAIETSSDSTASNPEANSVIICSSDYDQIAKALTDAYKSMSITAVKIGDAMKKISEVRRSYLYTFSIAPMIDAVIHCPLLKEL